MTTVGQRVRERMHQLSPQERRAARALTADYPSAGLGSSAQLAQSAGVSAPTVVRFARSLGYSGYPELQQALLEELSVRAASPLTRFEAGPGDESAHWLDHGVDLMSETARQSLKAIPHAELDAAVKLLADTRKEITCVGGRYSNTVARYLALHLQQLRPGVAHPTDLHSFGMASTIDAGKNDVYVIYDVRRYQRSTVELARNLHTRGARIILITDPWLSPVANIAEIVLPASVDSPTPFDSLAPAFILTELLVGAVLRARGNESINRMKQFETTSGYEMMP